MYDSGNLKKGLKIEIDNIPYFIINFEFVKPGKGRALYKCRLKNLLTGTQIDKTFRSGDKFNEANIEEIEMEYIYLDDKNYCFMNSLTYEQVFINKDKIGKANLFLKHNIICNVLLFKEQPIGISLPNFVNLKITKAEAWVKGDSSGNSTKPVKIETGYVLQVPPFINEGEIIKINTKTGEYVERIKT